MCHHKASSFTGVELEMYTHGQEDTVTVCLSDEIIMCTLSAHPPPSWHDTLPSITYSYISAPSLIAFMLDFWLPSGDEVALQASQPRVNGHACQHWQIPIASFSGQILSTSVSLRPSPTSSSYTFNVRHYLLPPNDTGTAFFLHSFNIFRLRLRTF